MVSEAVGQSHHPTSLGDSLKQAAPQPAALGVRYNRNFRQEPLPVSGTAFRYDIPGLILWTEQKKKKLKKKN